MKDPAESAENIQIWDIVVARIKRQMNNILVGAPSWINYLISSSSFW